jgi:hypothetical protein
VSQNVPATTSVPAPTSPVVAQHAPNAISPSEFVIDSGKYQGKTLGEVAKADLNYLKFYRSVVKDEAIKAHITWVLEAKPPMPDATPVAPASIPPTVVEAAVAVDQKTALVSECKTLLNEFPEFKGRGLSENMMPFLKSIIGRWDYTECDVAGLNKLKLALQARKASTAV